MALKKADLQVTNHSFPLSSSCLAGLANDDGLVVIAYNDLTKGPKVTTASIFAPGCLMFEKSGTSASTSLYANTGTTASVTWTVFTLS